ncbi:MAG: peptidoglycan-binding protein [Candidatus Omnitrophica bacterium]|nr:peptidoglycan-binding protein [Candidatus Omnitrophota bacterium]
MMLMKAYFVSFMACLVFFFLGCDSIYRMLDKEGAEEKEIIGDVLPYEKNPTVQEIQSLLKLYGYDLGKVDGILGRRTRDAIQRFQKDSQLKETRFVDDETWNKLRIFLDNNMIVDLRLNMTFIQQLLTYAGYDPGPVDGKPGPKTLQAVKKFQKDNGLKVDGKIGYHTLTGLSAYLPQVNSR